jgi:DivIVA domain-containing protein
MPSLLTGEQVLNALFSQTQFRVGYDEREVDDLLDRAVSALRHHEAGRPVADAPLASSEVAAGRFSQTKWRRGYDQTEVDAFLENLMWSLQQHESGGVEG